MRIRTLPLKTEVQHDRPNLMRMLHWKIKNVSGNVGKQNKKWMLYAREYIDDLTTKLTTECKRKNVSVAVLV